MSNFVIGIEGEVASGKTTICKNLINKFDNLVFMDGGNMYRGVVEAIKQANIDLNLLEKMGTQVDPLALLKKLGVSFKIEDKVTKVFIQDREVTEDELQTLENGFDVSKFASSTDNTQLFQYAAMLVEMYKKQYNILLSGRNVVKMYPNLDLHIFIKCDIDLRVERRYKQYKGKYSREELKKIIIERDEIHNKAGFNELTDKSVVIDISNCKTAKQSTDLVYEEIKKHINI